MAGTGISLSLPVVVDVASMPSVIARVRAEVANAIRAVAATEKDLRVTARLMEISAMVQQDLSHAEAKLAVQSPTVHRERVPLGSKPPAVTNLAVFEPKK